LWHVGFELLDRGQLGIFATFEKLNIKLIESKYLETLVAKK